jgi:SAM-dependent methyltransferase
MDFSRDKGLGHKILWRASYFLKKASRLVLGHKKSTKWLLDVSWVFKRLAFEASGEMFGNEFHDGSLATNPVTLSRVIRSDSRVLDIGCGTGRWTRVVADFGCHVLGVDHSPTNLEIARAQGGNAAYLEFDVTQKLSDLGTFDVALLIHVLEHIDDPLTLLKELRTNCSKLVIEVPDLESDTLNWARIKLRSPFYSDADHVREYSIDLIADQLAQTSWSISYKLQKGGAIFLVAE